MPDIYEHVLKVSYKEKIPKIQEMSKIPWFSLENTNLIRLRKKLLGFA